MGLSYSPRSRNSSEKPKFCGCIPRAIFKTPQGFQTVAPGKRVSEHHQYPAREFHSPRLRFGGDGERGEGLVNSPAPQPDDACALQANQPTSRFEVRWNCL